MLLVLKQEVGGYVRPQAGLLFPRPRFFLIYGNLGFRLG